MPIKTLNLSTRRSHPGQRLYTCNDYFFRKIDTAEKAYWLGYIYADGCVHRRFSRRPAGGYYLPQHMVGISSKDIEHLEKFRWAIDTDYPIALTRSGHGLAQVESYWMFQDLRQFGVTPRKSLTLNPVFPSKFARYVLRGIVDGDGSFNAYYRPPRIKKANGKGRPPTTGYWVTALSVTGTIHVCRLFQARFGGSVHRRNTPSGKTFKFQVVCQAAEEAIRWLYGGAVAPALDRKRNLAERLGLL